MAEMATSKINDLPDDAFAYIESGGTKDESGRTTPRSLRHFPVHDEAHARNALSRAPQSPFGDKAMPKILAAAKKFGITPAQDNRDAPTEQDPKVAAALSAAKDAVETARGAQALDPDNDTDPDDAAVSAHIDTAHQALTHALAAQAEDGADDDAGEPRSATPLGRRKRERHRAVPLMPEVRHFPASGLEVRMVEDQHEIVITGAPIVYDTPYTVVDLAGEFEERMSRGVARDVIGRNMDVRFLFNHGGLPLARTLAGTLTLRDSPDALRFTARLDSRQQLANDVAIAIERGDVSQMSCGFVTAKDEWNKDMTKRNVVLFRDLPDISAVTYPCSTSTSIEVARRMALELPVESRARLRKFYVDARAGMKMSGSNQDKVLEALRTMHSALGDAGVELPWEDDDVDAEPSTNDDGSQGGNTQNGETSDGIGSALADGSGLGSARALRLQLELRKRRLIAA